MGDWPVVAMPPPFSITPWHADSLHVMPRGVPSTAPVSGVTVQNQAYFYPFRIDTGAVANAMGVINGATQNGNIDMGIYDNEFNRIVSQGSTAAAGVTNGLKVLNITDTTLNPGTYWMAYVTDSATNTVFRTVAADEASIPANPMMVQASAFPLPNPAAPTRDAAATPVCVIAMAVSFLGADAF